MTISIGSLGVAFCKDPLLCKCLDINESVPCRLIDVDISFFQLVSDNYTEAAGPSDASAAASRSAKTPAGVFLDDSSCADSIHQELADLR